MKKPIISFIFILSISFSFTSCPTFAKTIPNVNAEIRLTNKNIGTTPQSRNNASRWRYKRRKGKLYKRLYNYTTKKWIGKWMQV